MAAAVLAATLFTAVAHADGADPVESSGVRVQLDNDLFALGGDSDRDYTGGMAITWSGPQAREGLLSLDPLLQYLDAALISDNDAHQVYYARQVGLMAFTPEDIEAAQPIQDDRPYASLVFVSNGRVSVDTLDRNAWSSELTVGMLGLAAAGELHSSVHELFGSEPVRGYANQISAGGEPTARYSLAHSHLWIANPSATIDVKTTVAGSVGYLTQASGAISVRIGRFATPWWSFAPELTDYIGAPMPVVQRSGGHQEKYFFAGARVTARAYNVFLQGQFRDSAVEYSASEVEPLVFNLWAGFVTQIADQTQVSYTLNYQSSELRTGQGDRDALWGGVQLSYSF